MARIIDTFIFGSYCKTAEKMLKFRLEYLGDSVDLFCICQCRYTFSGHRVQILGASSIIESLPEFLRKKVSLKTIDFTLTALDDPTSQGLEIALQAGKLFRRLPESTAAFERENYQRDGIVELLYDLDASDIVIHSDVDEIPDKGFILSLRKPDVYAKPLEHRALNIFMTSHNYRMDLTVYKDGKPDFCYASK